MNILVMGGAGFIGSHLVDSLLAAGYNVRVFDNLDAQVHGSAQLRPEYLNPNVALTIGDVRDKKAVTEAISSADAIYFLAAAVGVGQSMYEIERYIDCNTRGAGVTLEAIVEQKRKIKLIVASSMSIYGEGLYVDSNNELHSPRLRPTSQLEQKQWEVLDSQGNALKALPTPEDKRLLPTSVYAVTKRDHEELFLSVGEAYDLPVVALRFFNVYGTRQALSNPYTGVAAIFSSMLLNNASPLIFEDGKQSRDFVHVSDIVQALVLALERNEGDGETFNVGTGRATSVLEVAELLCQGLGKDIAPEVCHRFRAGDIRHCFADISKIQKFLGYSPKMAIADGFKELTSWVTGQIARNSVSQSTEELKKRNLIR
jgi:dTDP-L-rhamnose 4-epimerase